ncbi:unnamed protein product, partial [Coccothraustes coccothraustes]
EDAVHSCPGAPSPSTPPECPASLTIHPQHPTRRMPCRSDRSPPAPAPQQKDTLPGFLCGPASSIPPMPNPVFPILTLRHPAEG